VTDEVVLTEAADIMAALLEQAGAAGELDLGDSEGDLPFDLMDGLADEADPRAERLRELLRERGWAGWTRLERVPGRPDVG
jgi:hypothetical protein